jgi:hypothetical protein
VAKQFGKPGHRTPRRRGGLSSRPGTGLRIDDVGTRTGSRIRRSWHSKTLRSRSDRFPPGDTDGCPSPLPPDGCALDPAGIPPTCRATVRVPLCGKPKGGKARGNSRRPSFNPGSQSDLKRHRLSSGVVQRGSSKHPPLTCRRATALTKRKSGQLCTFGVPNPDRTGRLRLDPAGCTPDRPRTHPDSSHKGTPSLYHGTRSRHHRSESLRP